MSRPTPGFRARSKQFAYELRGRVRLRTRLREYVAARRTKGRIVDDFHRLYYDLRDQTWGATSWLGRGAWKCPLDLWIYQEIVVELKPDLIIESGTAAGGSALFLASICDLIGNGRIVTIDIEDRNDLPQHKRIMYLRGSSTSDSIMERVRNLVRPDDRVMVILDSDHRKEHVLRELELYSDLVTVGSYLIAEDTDINGHPVFPSFGPGPMEAVGEFLARDDRFLVDQSKEKFLMTQNPNGYLKKVKA